MNVSIRYCDHSSDHLHFLSHHRFLDHIPLGPFAVKGGSCRANCCGRALHYAVLFNVVLIDTVHVQQNLKILSRVSVKAGVTERRVMEAVV